LRNSAQNRDQDFTGSVVTLTVLGELPTYSPVVNFYTVQYTNQNYDNVGLQ